MIDARFVKLLGWLRVSVLLLGAPAVALSGCGQQGADGQGDDPGPGVDGTRSDASVDAPVDGLPWSDGPAAPDQRPADAFAAPGAWMTIPKGTFTMGAQGNELCTGSNEDQHKVTLTRDFELQTTEVTQEQFQQLMGYNPSFYSSSGNGPSCGKDCPVESVSWHESAAYCNKLSTLAGKPACYTCSGSDGNVACQAKATYDGQKIYDCPGYRLPTEAEWERAYRAGTQTYYYSGSYDSTICYKCSNSLNAEKIGWYCVNSSDLTHPVGQKQPNAWGLYDMAGNVREWCNDWHRYSLGQVAVTDPWGEFALQESRVSRGGSSGSYASHLRASRRFSNKPTDQYHSIGFRCGRTMP